MNWKLTLAAFLSTAVLAGCGGGDESAEKQPEPQETEETEQVEEVSPKETIFKQMEEYTFAHQHGAGYIHGELFVATHHGLLKFDGESWSESVKNRHDYMGFSPIEGGFFSSGHPEEGSDLKNPLGLSKSTDEGLSLEHLAFYGETDFHYMGAGYQSKAVYVWNEHPNSKIETGLYYTLDEGKTWTNSKANGLDQGTLGNIAVHPKKENTVALATSTGLFLSQDSGNQFKRISQEGMVPAAAYADKYLFYSLITNEEKNVLIQRDTETNKETTLNMPELEVGNPIVTIAANPEKPEEITVITFKNDIYHTTNGGEKWNKEAEEGTLK